MRYAEYDFEHDPDDSGGNFMSHFLFIVIF
jgi:hypothetical protein